MDSCLQQKDKWINAHKEAMRLHNRYKERICAEEREGVSIVEGRAEGGVWVHNGTIEERVY